MGAEQARLALEMLKRGQVLNADHPVVVLEDALDALEAEREALRKACERIAELTDGPAYPPALGHAILLARAALKENEA